MAEEKAENRDELLAEIALICHKHGAKSLILYGSFARGDYTYASDIDLCVIGIDDIEKWFDLQEDLENLKTLRSVNPLRWEHIHNHRLKEAITRDGKRIF